MKRYYLFCCGLSFILAACETETGTNERKWNPDAPWEPSIESLTRSEPLLISKQEFLDKTANTYYLDNRYYICSDSLGKVIFWSDDGEPSKLEYRTDSFEIEDKVFHSGQRTLYKFKNDFSGSVYRPRIPGHELADTGYYLVNEKGRFLFKERFAHKEYWCYDETDGTFALSFFPFTVDDARKSMFEWDMIDAGQLMELTDKYIIVRFYPANIRVWGDNPKASQLYKLTVFQAIKDDDYAFNGWYTDAFDADVEMGGYEWEHQADSVLESYIRIWEKD